MSCGIIVLFLKLGVMVSYILSLKEYMSWYLNIDTILGCLRKCYITEQFYINLDLVDNTLQCKGQVILQYWRRYEKKETLFIL